MNAKPDCYVGQKPCGCYVAVVSAGSEDDSKWVGKRVSEMIGRGLSVHHVNWDEFRPKLARCKCQKELI